MGKRDEGLERIITRVMEVLVGEPLWGSARVADMEMFAFGAQRQEVTSLGRERIAGTFALHVQCCWRIVGRNGIAVGYSDHHEPAEQSSETPDATPDRPDENLRDQKLAELFNRFKNRPLLVESVEADNVGTVRLGLSHGHVLELIPDAVGTKKDPPEHWRFIRRPSPDRSRHFVLIGDEMDELGDED